jgi:hypothetical protein
MTTRQWDVLQSRHHAAERLATEFDGIVPPERVASIVLQAASDLTGQVHTEAFPELLHRLAHYRLEIAVEQYPSEPPTVSTTDVHSAVEPDVAKPTARPA